MKAQRQLDTRLLITSMILLVLFLLLALVSFLEGRKVGHDSVLISTDAVPGSIEAHALRAAISRSIGYAMLASMADNDPAVRTRALAVSGEANQAFHTTLERYQSTIRINPGKDRQLVGKLQADWTEYQRQLARYVEQIAAEDRSTSNDFFVRTVLPAYEQVIKSAEELLGYNHSNILVIARGIEDSIGSLHWTAGIVVVLAVICGAILAVNIVTRRRQQRTIAESEQRLRLVLDNLFAYVAVLELDGTTVEVNRAALEVAGLSREKVIGTPFDRLPWWTESAEAQAKVRRALQQAAAGRTERYDTEVLVADGRKVTVDFGCGPLHNADGKVILLVATGVDITARKELEQQFLRAQRMDAIGMLAGGLAHDLNNILAPMLMAASLLKTRVTAATDQKMVSMIETGAQRGSDIIRQLLTFGRGGAAVKGPVQIRHLIREMIHIMKETFPRNLEFESLVPADLWPVEGDATQLHQVLLNLCVNARDAMPRGGKLSLNTENLTVDETNNHRHPQTAPGHYVLLTAADTGQGIPRDIINRIFDPFFTTKPVGKGTGLGLSTVLGIVKNHGGVVTVESEPERGTTFRVYLPRSEQAGSSESGPADDLPRGRGETILLVDDEAAMRDVTRAVLEQHNYRVLAAAHGEEALALFVAHRAEVRLVVTDVDMPVMTGVELIHTIRVLEPGMKIIVLSGSTQGETQEEIASLVAGAVLKKPCEPALLLHRMRGELAPPAGGS